jgi:hypothetical protein
MARPPQQPAYPPRIVTGVIVTCVICVFGMLQFSSAESAYQHQTHDPYMIEAQLTRFAPLASAVSQNATLGYLTDAQAGTTADSVLFTSTMYALAPRLVERGVTHDLVVGNFTRPLDFAAVGQSNGLHLQQDFGNGVVLFRKESRP